LNHISQEKDKKKKKLIANVQNNIQHLRQTIIIVVNGGEKLGVCLPDHVHFIEKEGKMIQISSNQIICDLKILEIY